MTPATRRTALVTGASTGIGRATVETLVGRGWRVWATVRGEDAAHSLTSHHGDRVRPLLLDVTDQASIAAAAARVRASGPLHGLVNNAGIASPGPLEHLPLDAFRHQLEVNVTGQLAVTQAMLPALRDARAAGEDARIVFVGSIGGRVAGAMLGAYHTTKFGIVGLSAALRAELAPSGIPVLLVEPGALATPIWDRGVGRGEDLWAELPPEARERYADQYAKAVANARRAAVRGGPASKAARAVADALTEANPRPRRLVGRDAVVAATLARVLPQRVIDKIAAANAGGG